MSRVLQDAPGTICHMDDILIFGKNATEHNERVRHVLRLLKEAGLTLNEKCEFSQTRLRFLGHVVTPQGIEADPAKTTAIRNFPAPANVTELQRFQGMVNQLAKFLPDLSNLNEPLRQLLRKDMEWTWGDSQQRAFQTIKDRLASTETLVHYDPRRPITVAADACTHGLGAVLLQTANDGQKRPICYASRSLTETESRYAVIEKEALAATWACDKFSDYILGLSFTLETDHKPLVPLLATKDLSEMPPRVLRFRLRMMRYNPTVVYVPGKDQVVADALSRAPTAGPDSLDVSFLEELDEFAATTMSILPATTARQREIRAAQDDDSVCVEVKRYCEQGWPAFMPHHPALQPYWEKRGSLTVIDGIILMNDRFVIPLSLRMDILDKIHQGHLGITKCQARARESVWWPLLCKEVEATVKKCHVCAKERPEQREPLLPSSFPDRPWERVGSDLFEFDRHHYILVVDYYSRWVEIRHLETTTSEACVGALKSVFATHGIPDMMISDNGPQYSSSAFREFTKSFGFTHVTSSPRYPQANGEAERAVRTVKGMLTKSEDPYLGLLAYRSAPLQNGLSPSQLLMGRQLRTTLPVVDNTLQPSRGREENVREGEARYRSNAASNYNSCHRVTTLPVLQEGDPVWVRDQERSGTVTTCGPSPRSYTVRSEEGQNLRRNR